MKKFLTLLFAVVTVAAFAVPTAQKAKKQQPQKSDVKVEMKAQMSDIYTGKAGMTRDFDSGVDTMYLAPKGVFFSAFFPKDDSFYYSVNACLIPGNTELTWTNISTGIASDTYEWLFYNPALDEEDFSSTTEKDLVTTYPNYPGGWVCPWLFVNEFTEDEYNAGNYYSANYAIIMGGKHEIDVLGDGTLLTNMYQFSPRASYNKLMSTAFGIGLSEEISDVMTILPDDYKPEGAISGKAKNFIQYFDYPGHPYTFSRIQFYAEANVTAGESIVAKVCRADNGIDLDNPIATAVYEFPTTDTGDSETAIDFYFEKVDPDLGLTEEDWLEIDGDIAIVIEGVDQLQSIYPVMQGISYAADMAHDPELYQHSCNGYTLIEFYDENNSPLDAELIPCHLGHYWGSTIQTAGLPVNYLLSINAQFAYIETVADNATEYTIPATGGEYTLELKASEPYDAWAVDDMPEWISIEAEDVFETDEEGNEEYTGYTNLTISVEPNNNGEVVYTLPGTEFKIIVGNGGGTPAVPGDVDGDGTVTAGDITALYNYLLNSDMTGIVNGDVDGDGTITAGDVTMVYNILLGAKK
jgi:hypothetical protein